MVLWAILIGLFYLLRPFFLLIFQTFLLTYIAKGTVQWIVKRTKLNYRLTVIAVFVFFVGLLFAAGNFVGPRLIVQSSQILADFADSGEQQTTERTNRFVENTVTKIIGKERGESFIDSQGYASIIEFVKAESSKGVRAAMPSVLQGFLHFLKLSWEILISLIMSIIFSFVLVIDWQKIAETMKKLERSRIGPFYIDAAPHLQAFADVLGKSLRAQAVIATCNTLLTAIGLFFLGVPNIALLSTIVFFCGFIPILGTFISSIPILLFGIQVGGLPMVFKIVAFVALIHAFEAYVLNPKITADILHIHPILVLVLLVIGERFFGIWGMVVGVPIGYYIISVLIENDDETDGSKAGIEHEGT